jgi:hypothetical protein
MSKPKAKPLSKEDKVILKHADSLNAFVDRYFFVCETLKLRPSASRWLFNNPKEIDRAFKKIVGCSR